jgi:acyl transferase domain-containing protein
MKNKDVAIVGISCRFPKAKNTDQFWQILNEGKQATSKVPEDRWDMNEYYDPNIEVPNKTNQNVGGFLEDIHHFDPQLFNISPVEAYEMSPSQKLIMELAWELVESSSIPYMNVAGSNTGVYIGTIWSDFEMHRKNKNTEINNFSGIGFSANVIANRISYFLGLTGPSYVLDTGCSSALIAIMQCIEAIQHGKINMGIAGGINHILVPDQYIYLGKFGGLSSEGKCSCFDDNADGFVRSEGAGLVLLKPLSEAEKDGDKILAVVRGGAMNNNGFNSNMPATSVRGQLELFNLAYTNAGVDPADIHYIEAHGSGTRLGDPVEAEAIGNSSLRNLRMIKRFWLGLPKLISDIPKRLQA